MPRTRQAPPPSKPTLEGTQRLEVLRKAHAKGEALLRDGAPDVDAWGAWIDSTGMHVEAAFGKNSTQDHSFFSAGQPLSVTVVGAISPAQEAAEARERFKAKVLSLGSMVSYLEDLQTTAPAEASKQSAPATGKKVFVVHGHDTAAKDAVARFLGRLGLDPIILHEQPNNGRTIIEKFEDHAGDVGYAVVLMTPDDVGGVKGSADQSPRARQNVVFELGYFFGALGRGRVAALSKGDIERLSDISGILYTELDDEGAWHLKLARDLRAALGDLVDMNKL